MTAIALDKGVMNPKNSLNEDKCLAIEPFKFPMNTSALLNDFYGL